jgi:hypothetical protein
MKKKTDYKSIFIETAMRFNLVFPVNEEQDKQFTEKKTPEFMQRFFSAVNEASKLNPKTRKYDNLP